jgi:hypothetical protein
VLSFLTVYCSQLPQFCFWTEALKCVPHQPGSNSEISSSSAGIGVSSNVADVRSAQSVSFMLTCEKFVSYLIYLSIGGVPPHRARAFETVLLCARQTCDGH